MYTCSKCNTTKDITEFSIRTTGKPNSWCKECIREYNRIKYQSSDEEKIRIRKNGKNSNDRSREFINSYLNDKKCRRCGFNHPAALDFHHLDPSTKKTTLAAMKKGGYSLKTIQEEIDKCIILCSNCHRIEHYNERNGALEGT